MNETNTGTGHTPLEDGPGVVLGNLHDLVDRVRDLAREGATPATVAAAWAEAQAVAEGLAERLDGERALDLLDRLSLAMEELEQSARSFFRETAIGDDEAARRLAVLRAVSRMMLRLARLIEGRPPRDETPFLLQQLRELDRVLVGPAAVEIEKNGDNGDENGNGDEEAGADGEPPLEGEIDRIRFEILEGHARALLELAVGETNCDRDCVGRIFRTSRALRRITFELEECADDADAPDLSERLRKFAGEATREQGRLQGLFLDWLRSIDDEADMKPAAKALLWVTGELDEARSGAADRANRRRLAAMEGLRQDGIAVHRAFRVARRRFASKDPDGAIEDVDGSGRRRLFSPLKVERKLGRMIGRLRNAVSDRILALRLNSIFGARQVRIWEAMVFWLIMAVIGLIVVDHFGEPDAEGTIGWTTWVDTGICVVLLWDFFVRLLLSPDRLRYFRRAFLTEFLPSLPFGLISSLDALGVATVRGFRLVRLLRALRIIRPLLRLVRLFLFLARAVDRLVERNAWILNQNIVFFSDPEHDEEDQTLLNRARELDSWISRRGESRLADLSPVARREGCRWQLALIEAELPFARPHARLLARGRTTEALRDLQVDDVVARLRDLDDNQVAEFVGADVARQITNSLSFFRLPLLRSLPIVRFILGPTGAPDPLWTTARLGRLAGDGLAWLQRVANWFADLHGTITGAQFLDRLGMQLVKATQRPAKRLLIFGGVIGIIYVFAHLTRFGPLIKAVEGITGVLTGPLIFIGVVCFVPLIFGTWLRRIAGQAVDMFDRVAEAQFLALTEISKEHREDDDLAVLVDRVLLPDVALGRDPEENLEAERDLLLRAARREKLPDDVELPVAWSALESMMLFYRDFIDGAYFHSNDTKIANMLLGNLTLENIRRNRLRFDSKRFKQLDRLDIARGKGGLTGPKVWFDFITHSVSQHVARLIIEYNQHCIPADELEAADENDRQIFEDWLERRHELSESRRRDEATTSVPVLATSGEGGSLVYRTTEFNALHFLTVDGKRDRDVERRYGEKVAQLLVEDRENLVRDIFGTYPMHEQPKENRTINPYVHYRRYLSRGRVFFAPFTALWLLWKGLRLLFSRVVKIVKDVLNPNARMISVKVGHASFDVARRKVFRMRRPVVLETVRLRALFDLEYAGIAMPFDLQPSPSAECLVDDLRYLEASEREWERFREIKTERERQVRLMVRLLQRMTERGHDFFADLARENPHLVDRRHEALRAATTAFVCDHEKSASIISALDGVGDLLIRAATKKAKRRHVAELVARKRVQKLIERARPLLEEIFEEMRETDSKELARLIVTRYPHEEQSFALLADLADEGADPQEQVYRNLLQVAGQPSSWNEQIVALRAVQTLGILDLQGYEDLIRKLGRYAPDDSAQTVQRRRLDL